MDTQNTQHKTTVPVADRIKHVVKFGDVNDPQRGQNLMNPPREMEDYYYWMRDDSRTSTKVIEHLNNENNYTERIMKPYDNLKNELY